MGVTKSNRTHEAKATSGPTALQPIFERNDPITFFVSNGCKKPVEVRLGIELPSGIIVRSGEHFRPAVSDEVAFEGAFPPGNATDFAGDAAYSFDAFGSKYTYRTMIPPRKDIQRKITLAHLPDRRERLKADVVVEVDRDIEYKGKVTLVGLPSYGKYSRRKRATS